MSESKSEFRQYVTAPMTDKDLITMVYKFWPHGKINLTKVVLDTLVKKCISYIFSPKNEAVLRSHIRKIWSKRKQILGETLFAELDAKRTRFSDEDEEVLKVIYAKIPRREKALTLDIIENIPEYSQELIRDVWNRRLFARDGEKRYREFKNRPRLTPEEQVLLTKIYLNWPRRVLALTKSNRLQIAKDIGVTESKIEYTWSLKQWYPNAPQIYYWQNRLVAAIAAGNRLLFDHYIDQDDINGHSFGGTPLMEAIRCRRRYMFDVLMEMGADVNSIVGRGYRQTALINACYVPSSQINEYVGLLLDAGADHTVSGGITNMPPLWYYLKWVKTPTFVERFMPIPIEALNRQTPDSHWVEARFTILMMACLKHFSVVPILLTVAGLDVNQKTNYKNTALHFAAEKAPPEIIQQLLTVPGIEKNIENKHSKTPMDIAYCRGAAIIDIMDAAGCRRNRVNEVCRLHADDFVEMAQVVNAQVAEQTTRSSSPDPSSPMMEPQTCIKFHLNQGNVGICYMVSVIALFQNEFTILHKLKECVNDEEENILLRKELKESNIPEIDPTIKELLAFLSKDYSNVDFDKECPVLPATWRKTVHQTSAMTREDIINGGSEGFLLMFIFQTLNAWHDIFNIFFGYFAIKGKKNVQTDSDKQFQRALDAFESDHDKNIALIDLDFKSFAQMQLKVGMWNPFGMVDKLARKPNVRGFIVRVSDSNEKGHVFAGTVCDEFSGKKVLYCNSWGKGCVDYRQIHQELYDSNPRYKITTIHFVLRK